LIYSDKDVEEEAKRVENSTSSEYSVKVNKLRKVYKLGFRKTKTAVHHVSFGIKNGDCFALLGANGAGKTTTFKMLSGDILQTAGTAHINGFEIPEELNKAQLDIGYCPQNDPLLENLTAREHLELYAALRGVNPKQRKKIVEQQLQEMNLSKYANVLAGSYSGGTRRKLSVAIAMIGNPSIVFLDEPSTGMDPEARRFMWDVITRISKERKKSTVILTTHSMDEAEALSTKVGIMVEGRLKCLGTVQHIKNKYGGGYEVEIKLNLVSKAQITEAAHDLGLTMGAELNKTQIENLLKQVGMTRVLKEDSEESKKSGIPPEIKQGKISVDFLMEWILNEKNGQKLKGFFEKHFEGTALIEQISTFYRFRISSNISIGTVFGTIEENKTNLGITQYSVRQSSIEQIFNMFATNSQPEPSKKHPQKILTNPKDLEPQYSINETQLLAISPLTTPNTAALISLEQPTIIEVVSPIIQVKDLENSPDER